MRALVVDDSRAMRRIVSGVLHGLGYETEEAADGQQALDVLTVMDAAGRRPHLACIDWNMPVMDGLTLVGRIREQAAWRDVTMMMVTTESEHGRVVRALAAGAHEYLIKPFTSDAMRDKLALLGLLPEPVAGAVS
ncbi:response regulator [Angustibacter aerolatus]